MILLPMSFRSCIGMAGFEASLGRFAKPLWGETWARALKSPFTFGVRTFYSAEEGSEEERCAIAGVIGCNRASSARLFAALGTGRWLRAEGKMLFASRKDAGSLQYLYE